MADANRNRVWMLAGVVAVAALRDWEPVLQPWLPPLLGIVVGLVAGAYPAIRAAPIEPVDALRTG